MVGSMETRLKILWVLGGAMSYGGIELFVMNHLRHFDFKKFEISLLIHGEEIGVFESELNDLRIKMFHLPIKSKHPILYFKRLRDFFKNYRFDIVHTHLDAMGSVILRSAKKNGVEHRFAHSHNTKHLTRNPIKWTLNEIARFSIRRYATGFLACSVNASTWLFGKNHIKNGDVNYIKNAIETSKFLFNEDDRNQLRKQYGFESDDVIIGQIGRFDYQKNHEFTLRILQQIIKTSAPIKLVLIGEGHLKENLFKSIEEYNIRSNVTIIKPQKEVHKFYNMFDLFVLPSRFEGLGMVAIEAQINGLPCFVSDKVPLDVKITNNLWHISIKNTHQWVHNLSRPIPRIKIDLDLIEESGYEIKSSTKMLMDFYSSRS